MKIKKYEPLVVWQAKNLISAGLSLSKISKYTGIPYTDLWYIKKGKTWFWLKKKEDIYRKSKPYKIKEKICLLCKKQYSPTATIQKYCGKPKEKGSCSYKMYLINKHKNRIPKLSPKRFCIYCQKQLIKNQVKYCSICKKRAKAFYRKRQVERKRKKKKYRRLNLRFYLLTKSNFTCQYCGRKAPNVELQIDHRFPKSRGGMDSVGNYIVSCKECNLGKRDIILSEFL